MFSLIRLAFLYCLIGVGLLFVQFNNTPCSAPVVFDDGGPPIGPPINVLRLSVDNAYAWRMGKLVVFWLPRLVDLVGIRGMPFPDYLFGRTCRKLDDGGSAPPPAFPRVNEQVPAPPPSMPAQPGPYTQPQPVQQAPAQPVPLPRPRG